MSTGLNIINSGRGAGKTYRLVQWVLEDPENRVIYCRNAQQAAHLRQQYGLTPRQTVTPEGVYRGDLRGRRPSLAVDDAETLITGLLAKELGVTPKIIATNFEEFRDDDGVQMSEFFTKLSRVLDGIERKS